MLFEEKQEQMITKFKAIYRLRKRARGEVNKTKEFITIMNKFDLFQKMFRRQGTSFGEPFMIFIVNIDKLETLIDTIGLHNLKTKTDVYGVTNDIDWI